MGCSYVYGYGLAVFGIIIGAILVLVGFLVPTECQVHYDASRCTRNFENYKEKQEKNTEEMLLHCKLSGYGFLGVSGMFLLFFIFGHCMRRVDKELTEELPLNPPQPAGNVINAGKNC